MNSQLEIKLATKMTDTPETDAMEYCDAMCDPDRVVEADFARKLERERDEAQETIATMEIRHAAVMLHTQSIVDDANQCREQRDQLEGRLRVELGGHPDSELWGDAGLIAASMRCVDALDVVTEQRDDAREQLRKAQVENDHNWQAIEMYEAERALADRLALALKMTRWDSPVTCKKALAAWKEVRSES